MTETLYTIGHSSHPIEGFLSLLGNHRMDVVADVRSVPYSRFNPQFNKEALAASLREAGMRYIFFGKELGARPDDPSCYVGGRVQYPRIAATPAFQQAVDRIIEGSKTYRIAMMCAEAEPLDCHRTILVAQALAGAGGRIQHILANGDLESHDDALDRLVGPLLAGDPESLQEVLAKREASIAYRQPAESK